MCLRRLRRVSADDATTFGWVNSISAFLHILMPAMIPIRDRFPQAIKESAEEATREYFQKGATCFEEGQHVQATEHLCRSIICSIAAIAASKGWPHADRDDDLNAVVALATGTLPQEAGQIHELLSTTPGQGQSLNSAFAVAMGQPDVAKDGFFYDSSRGYDEDAILRQKNRGVGQPAGTESAMTGPPPQHDPRVSRASVKHTTGVCRPCQLCPLPAMQFPPFWANHQSSPKPLRSSASLLAVLQA